MNLPGHRIAACPGKAALKPLALQTLRAVRRHPAVAKHLECVRLQRRFPKAGFDSRAGQVHGKPPFAFCACIGTMNCGIGAPASGPAQSLLDRVCSRRTGVRRSGSLKVIDIARCLSIKRRRELEHRAIRNSCFVIRSSLVIRHSSFRPS